MRTLCVYVNQKYLCQKGKLTRENVIPTAVALLRQTTLFTKSLTLFPCQVHGYGIDEAFQPRSHESS